MKEHHLTAKEYHSIKHKNRDGKYITKDSDGLYYATFYWVNGKHHREDGPAIEYHDGDKEWYFKGMLHRLDGPAVEENNGYSEYYICGDWIHPDDYNEAVIKNYLK